MAKPPRPSTTSGESTLEKKANDRKRDARRWKNLWLPEFMECYFFAAPQRERQLSSRSRLSVPPKDDALLQTSLAYLLVDDFVTEIVNTYMPEAQNWCERGPGMFVHEDVFKNVRDQVRKQDKQIFEAIKASNLYTELPKAFIPDLAIGTCAIAIQRRRPHLPIEVIAVPLRELDCNLGPDGMIDDRWWSRSVRNQHIEAILPKEAQIPENVRKRIDKKGNDRSEVSFGFWRLWDRDDDEWWQHVIMVEEDLVHSAELQGEGSCPLIPARFNPTADWPFGTGPLMKALPTLRQVDELEMAKIEAVGRNLRPPLGVPDDSFLPVEQGIEDGEVYAMRPGVTKDHIVSLMPTVEMESSTYQTEEMETRLRKLFYGDFPQQRGDTPPTLGQWLDEMARAQRRIGTPGAPFWREMPMQIFLRFKFLLEAAGSIEPIATTDGKMISMRPYNPAQRAAEQQEIATAMQFAQAMSQMFPEEWRIKIDGGMTMAAFMSKMRVADLIKFRDDNAVKAIMPQLAQLMGARQRLGGEAPQGAGAPAAT